jgi:hypothetical protein
MAQGDPDPAEPKPRSKRVEKPPKGPEGDVSGSVVQAKGSRVRLTPSEHHVRAVTLHIRDITRERVRLLGVSVALQSELDNLRPEYARLKEAHSAAIASNIFSTAMVGIGGTMVSGAGYAGGATTKLIILLVGCVTFTWGMLFQITATWRSCLARPR